ncbi:PfkB family carbohydrate kinase, partial [Actinomadura kijaniata]|uniref:PfkB family carbohydrate kinase n=1 Tax=Actinomadura kijaniata TaxID=46161 RepID=UPI003F1C9409
IDRRGQEGLHVPAVPVDRVVDPTGGGDAFRAGFLTATAWGLSLERSAQVGNLIAAHVLETAGPQEYTLGRRRFLDRFAAAYGQDAADEVAPHLACAHP